MNRPLATVIVCTRDPGERLRATLTSLVACREACEFPFEVCVIDSASQGGSVAETVSSIGDAELVHCHRIGRPGLSVARNFGLSVAKGEAVLWTDDDVLVPRTWVHDLATPLLEGRGDALVGGWRTPMEMLPRWARASQVHGDHDSTRFNFQEIDSLSGLNMAFHRRVLKAVPQFDPELGAGALGFGEDSLFGWQLKEAGFVIRGLPDLIVEHRFDVSRLNRSALLKRAARMGESSAYIAYHWRHEDPVTPTLAPQVKAALGRQVRRLKHLFRADRSYQLSEKEFGGVVRYADARMAESLRGQPRKYALRGLVRCDAGGA